MNNGLLGLTLRLHTTKSPEAQSRESSPSNKAAAAASPPGTVVPETPPSNSKARETPQCAESPSVLPSKRARPESSTETDDPQSQQKRDIGFCKSLPHFRFWSSVWCTDTLNFISIVLSEFNRVKAELEKAREEHKVLLAKHRQETSRSSIELSLQTLQNTSGLSTVLDNWYRLGQDVRDRHHIVNKLSEEYQRLLKATRMAIDEEIDHSIRPPDEA